MLHLFHKTNSKWITAQDVEGKNYKAPSKQC